MDVEDGALIWGEQYNRKPSDIMAVEDEISQEISDKLRLKLTGAQKKKLTRRYTENNEAYQLYLKGRFYWNKRTEESLKRGVEYFEEAIVSDPHYALAFYNRGRARLLAGDGAGGEADLATAKQLNPKIGS